MALITGLILKCANLLNQALLVFENNKGYGPFEYHVKKIPNRVLSNKQIFETISWSVNFGNGLILTYLLKTQFLFPVRLQTKYKIVSIII